MNTERHPFGKWSGSSWPALSLRQPWLWAIFELGKDIENRRWNTKYRGPVWLHAAKGCTFKEMEEALHFMSEIKPFMTWPWVPNLERGGVCGIAEIFDVIPPNILAVNADERRWHMKEQYGFRIRNVRRFPMIPMKGALGLFRLPPDVERQALAALEAA